MADLIFITGGTRSGKSDYAQQRAEAHSGPLLYLATGTPGDAEMRARIRRHQAARGPRWQTLEEPLDLTGRMPAAAAGKGAILLDCLTLWLTNQFFRHEQATAPVLEAVDQLVSVLSGIPAPVYLVSNEIGFGIVPENALARRFRDLAGEANQRLAAAARECWLVVAGLPLQLK